MSSEAQQEAVFGALQRTGMALQIGDLARETGLPESQVRDGLSDLVAEDLVTETHGGFFSLGGPQAKVVAAVPPIETIEAPAPGEGPQEITVPDAQREPTEVMETDDLTLNSVFRSMLGDGRALLVRAEVVMVADEEGVLSVRRVEKILSLELGE